MERELSRSGRRAVARTALAGVLVLAALPAGASADKPADTPGNGPPATPGSSGHGPKSTPPGHANHGPRGRAVRAHGAPATGGGTPSRSTNTHPAVPGKSHGTEAPSRSQAAQAPESHTNNGAAHQKTTICHATGSATNPYVEITISDRAVKAHARHQDGRDIIPAPSGGCPTAAAAAQQTASTVAASIQAAAPAAGTETRSTAAPPAGTPGTATPDSGVAGVVETNRAAAGDASGAPARSPLAATERSGDGSGSLPFTGLDVALALLIAGGLILAGVTVRRAAMARRTTV